MARLARKLNKFKKMLLKNPTMSPTDIAMKVYNCKNRNSAGSIANEMCKKLAIDLRELFDRAGLNNEFDISYLTDKLKAKKVISCNVVAPDGEDMKDADSMTKDFVEVDDNQTQLKAFELLQKLKGRLFNNNQENKNIVTAIQVNIPNANEFMNETKLNAIRENNANAAGAGEAKSRN